jgi:hypothetical protein
MPSDLYSAAAAAAAVKVLTFMTMPVDPLSHETPTQVRIEQQQQQQ